MQTGSGRGRGVVAGKGGGGGEGGWWRGRGKSPLGQNDVSSSQSCVYRSKLCV